MDNINSDDKPVDAPVVTAGLSEEEREAAHAARFRALSDEMFRRFDGVFRALAK